MHANVGRVRSELGGRLAISVKHDVSRSVLLEDLDTVLLRVSRNGVVLVRRLTNPLVSHLDSERRVSAILRRRDKDGFVELLVVVFIRELRVAIVNTKECQRIVGAAARCSGSGEALGGNELLRISLDDEVDVTIVGRRGESIAGSCVFRPVELIVPSSGVTSATTRVTKLDILEAIRVHHTSRGNEEDASVRIG